MSTLLQLFEFMDQHKNKVKSESDTLALEAMRNGRNLRKPNCGDFWEDFITICNNPESVAALLGVSKENVTGWATKIREAQEKLDQEEDHSDKKRSEVLPTGDKLNLGNENEI